MTVVRVSVVAGNRRVDLAVPLAVPVAELLPGLAGSLAVSPYDGLRLTTLTGVALDDSAGLAGHDGEMLVLAPSSVAPVVHDDPVEALDAVAAVVPGWPISWTGPAVTSAVAALLGVATAGVLSLGQARIAVVAALVATAGCVLLDRRDRPVAVAFGWAGSALAGASGWLLGPSPPLAWVAAGSGVLATGGVLAAGLGERWLLPPLLPGAAAALIGVALPHLALHEVVPLVLVGAVLLHRTWPWLLAMRLGSAIEPADLPGVDMAHLATEAARTRELLTCVSTGTGMLVTVLGPAAATSSAGAGLGAVSALLVLLQAGHHRSSSQILVGLLTAVATGLGVAGLVLVRQPTSAPAVPALAGLAVVLLLLPAPPRRLLVRAEVTCLAVLPPLLLLSTGALERLPWSR